MDSWCCLITLDWVIPRHFIIYLLLHFFIDGNHHKIQQSSFKQQTQTEPTNLSTPTYPIMKKFQCKVCPKVSSLTLYLKDHNHYLFYDFMILLPSAITDDNIGLLLYMLNEPITIVASFIYWIISIIANFLTS